MDGPELDIEQTETIERGDRFYREPEPATFNGDDRTDKIAAALAKAQAAFLPIEQNRLVEVKTDKGKYDFRYATLNEIISKTRAALTENGIAMTQRVIEGEKYVETLLMHESGQTLRSLEPIFVAQGRGHPAQAFGGAQSYARRYGLAAALGISSDDESDIEAAETAAAMQDAAFHASTRAAKAASNASKEEFWEGPMKKAKLQETLRAIDTDLAECSSLDMWITLRESENYGETGHSYAEIIDQCQRDLPGWWFTKQGSDKIGLADRIKNKTAELENRDLEGPSG